MIISHLQVVIGVERGACVGADITGGQIPARPIWLAMTVVVIQRLNCSLDQEVGVVVGV